MVAPPRRPVPRGPAVSLAALLLAALLAAPQPRGARAQAPCAPPYDPSGAFDLRVAPGEARAFAAALVIPAGARALFEGNVTVAGGVTVAGTLYLSSSSPSRITADWLAVAAGGALVAGSAACPLPAWLTATIELRDGSPHPDAGRKALAVLAGGTLELHGAKGLDTPWARLAETAPAGASAIALDAPVATWAAGDEVAVASTDYDPYQTERVRIASVSGSRVTLAAPLRYMHFGAITMGVDERAEASGFLTGSAGAARTLGLPSRLCAARLCWGMRQRAASLKLGVWDRRARREGTHNSSSDVGRPVKSLACSPPLSTPAGGAADPHHPRRRPEGHPRPGLPFDLLRGFCGWAGGWHSRRGSVCGPLVSASCRACQPLRRPLSSTLAAGTPPPAHAPLPRPPTSTPAASRARRGRRV
jgi:hypothetical protein